MRKKNRNPASKESSGLREKAKGGLPDGALVFFNKLGWSRSLWTVPWQQPAEKRQADDLFRAGRPERRRRGGEEGKSEVKRGYSRSRANLNGGELDCENTSGTHKGGHKRRGVPSQGQPKWWRAGRGVGPP